MREDEGMTDGLRFSIGDLRIGVATCATQIEGGRRDTNWADWAALPGRIKDGSTPLRTTDHWNRWREDTALMAELGLQVYRLGIEWSRIEPTPGDFDTEAIARYRDEIEAVRAAGIEPMVTLHHFTHPSWFEAIGGWTSEVAVETWLRFVRFCVEHLDDLVTDWCTINEPNVFATGGYLFGEFPPGRRNDWGAIRRVLRTMARAHCAAYDLIHELQPSAKVGFAHHLRVFEPLNPRNPVHRALARSNAYLFQEALTDAFLGGRFARVLGGQPDDVTPGRRYDWLGINYYSRTAVSKMDDGTFPGAPVNDLGWEIHPEGLVTVARWLHERYPGPIWVTENGTCDNDDSFRSLFLHDHLRAMATSGLPFERYYHWCFVDNWEWAEGNVPRFGIVALDDETLERTVKDSGRFLASIVAAGGVTEEAYAAHVAPQRYRVDPAPVPRG
jgi:beta-glucosidase